MDSIIERLREIVKQHPELAKSGFIKGLDSSTGNIIVVINGQEKSITIDELERLVNPQIVKEPIQNININKQVEEPVEVMEEIETVETLDVPNVNASPIVTPQVMPEQIKEERQIRNLKDMQDAVIAKDERAIDKAIEPFAMDNNGKINVNKAIAMVTDNSTNNVISCMRDNTTLPLDLTKFDITGKPLEPFQVAQGRVELNDLINNSFSNIMVYVGVSRLKNQVFNDEQIEKAKNRYTRNINDKLNVLGLNKPLVQQQNNIVDFNQKKEEKSMSLELKPDNNIKKAGFADILILTIIVIIYAAIIINLVSKLN